MAPGIKAALFQLHAALGEPKRNLATLAKRVQASKADLCVFPELYLTGYFNRDLLRGLAEPLDGPMVGELKAIAKRTGAHIITGMPRVGEQRGVVHNSSVLVTPEVEAHAYDKVYLPTFSVFEEDLYFGEGHRLPVVKTSLGKIGMCICYDLFFPEVTKALALQGADILTAISASPTISRRYFETVLPARALETTSFLLYTNLVGPQDTITFWGGAKVYGPMGDLQAEGPLMKEAMVKATLDLEELHVARAKRPVLRDTRPELLGWQAQAAQTLPQELRLLEAFHGHLSAWVVAGWRMGKAARGALKVEGQRPKDLRAQVTAPRERPAACALDGVQVGAGCTTGKGNLQVLEGQGLAGRFETQGKTMSLRLRPEIAKRFEAPKEQERDVAMWVYALPEAELFERSEG